MSGKKGDRQIKHGTQQAEKQDKTKANTQTFHILADSPINKAKNDDSFLLVYFVHVDFSISCMPR